MERKSDNGRSPRALLQSEPYRFGFFQAVRLLGLSAHANSADEFRPVGEDFSPDEEMVRFRALASHAFPASSIASMEGGGQGDGEENRQLQMVVTFMGFTGPSGVLPQHYTRMLIDRIRRRDFALRDFWDLFNHRIISHFYRAWQKNQFAISYEAAALKQRTDPFSLGLFSLLGQGTAGLRRRLEVDDEAFLYYGGQFARFPRSAISMECVIADHFGLPTRIRQFQGQWLSLNSQEQTRMPSSESSLAGNNQLGVSAIAGERVWSIESKFRIRFGPLNYQQFRRLTPMGDRLLPLAQFVRRYIGRDLDFDVQLVLRRDQVPPCVLSGDPAGGPRLGWTTWIHNGDLAADVDDAVFEHEGLLT